MAKVVLVLVFGQSSLTEINSSLSDMKPYRLYVRPLQLAGGEYEVIAMN